METELIATYVQENLLCCNTKCLIPISLRPFDYYFCSQVASQECCDHFNEKFVIKILRVLEECSNLIAIHRNGIYFL